MEIVNYGNDTLRFVMDSGNFKIFRKLSEEEKQLRLFCTDCDCESECLCSNCDCDKKNKCA